MRYAHVNGILGLLAVIIMTFAIAMIVYSLGEGNVAVEDNTTYITPETLSSLIMGPDELPWDTVLGALRVGSNVTPNVLGAFNGKAKFGEVWSGCPIQKPGGMMSPDYCIDIAVAIADSAEEATGAASRYIRSFSIVAPEITGDENVNSFADQAWYSDNKKFDRRGTATSASITFVRRNVLCSLRMSNNNGVDKSSLFTLAAQLSKKIDAIAAGQAQPVPVLPLAADQELRVDLEGAWEMRDLGTRLWGNESTTIAIYDTNGIPRSLPAKLVGTDDYVVPLRHLAAIVGPNARVKVKDDEVKTTLMGRALVFNKGKSEIQLDQHAAQLDRPVEFMEGEVIVPLTSVVRNALGKGIAWEQRGAIMIGRVE